MALRIKARFVSTRVLPSEMYKKFAEHVSTNYLSINQALSNVISVSRKDEIARILVNIMYGTGCITVSWVARANWLKRMLKMLQFFQNFFASFKQTNFCSSLCSRICISDLAKSVFLN